MSVLDYVILGFCIIGSLFIVVSIVQILLLRSRMSDMWKQTAASEMQVKDSLESKLNSDNKLQVYSLKVNREYTRYLSNSATVFFKSIVDLALPHSTSTTLSCKNSVQYVNVSYSSVGFIVLDPSIGSEELIHDIITNKLKYFVLKDVVFDVRYNKSIEDKMLKRLMEYPVFKDISKCNIIMLYSPFHAAIAAGCDFNMKLFSGSFEPPSEYDGCIDLVPVLNITDSNKPNILTYALGYKPAK